MTIDDDDEERTRACPKCSIECAVSTPEELDVGIFGDTFGCIEHGEFYEDCTGALVFCENVP